MPAVSTMLLNSLIMTGEKAVDVTSFTATEQDYHVSRLNSMMDSWSNERNFIFSVSVTSFALTTSKGVYTIGNGGDFNMPRPIRVIDPCWIRDTDGFDTNLILIDNQAYGALTIKTTDGTYPAYLYVNMDFSATSTATLSFWPEPAASLSTFLSTLSPLQTFSTMSTNLLMPPGYQRAIETNYAIESSPGFASISPELAKIARESKSAIKSINASAPISKLDYGVVGNTISNSRRNILTGP